MPNEDRSGGTVAALSLVSLLGLVPVPAASADEVYLPIVMPITGFLSVEGARQRNGAVMAIEDAPAGVSIRYENFRHRYPRRPGGDCPRARAQQWRCRCRAVHRFGTEMVAMAPIAQEYEVPLLTISGLTKLTHSGNPYIFRFLPNDGEIKVAQVHYAIERWAGGSLP